LSQIFAPPDPQDPLQAGVQAETAPRPVRRLRTRIFELYLLLAVIAFGVLALLSSTTAYFAIDLTITQSLQRNDPAWLDFLMRLVSWPGRGVQAVALSALVFLLLYRLGLRWEAAVSLLASAGAHLLNQALKWIIHRPRPASDLVDVFGEPLGFSFPSGHVMFYTIFFGFLWFLVYVLLRPSFWRSALLVLTGALVLLVGPSRVFLGEHWASDVAGAYLMGSLGLWVAIRVYERGKKQVEASAGR
jgi:undecaprenyl-diphosphatase